MKINFTREEAEIASKILEACENNERWVSSDIRNLLRKITTDYEQRIRETIN